jgi:flavin reductase (DIM6/NTAB) family NADH-FMN oxidoreductase RutF
MKLDLLHEHADRAYPILAALITPRPIAWVTTLHENGKVNAAPFSFFNMIGDDPPMLMFCPGNREDGTPKDTARNCRRTKEFVVNLVDEPLGEVMVRTSASLAEDLSETEHENLETSPSSTITTPRITAAPAALECKLHEIWEFGGNRMVIGVVQCVHVRDELFDPVTLRIRAQAYHSIGRMAVPDWYCRTDDQYEMKRPR